MAVDTNNVTAIQALPEPFKRFVLNAFAHAIDDVFLRALPFVGAALIVSFFLKERPLQRAHGTEEAPEHAPGQVTPEPARPSRPVYAGE